MDLGLAGHVGVVGGDGGEARAATERLLREEGAEVVEGAPEGLGEVGDVDFLVTFAGEAPADDRRAGFELDVMETMRAMKALAPLLAEHGRGRIVNVVSAADPVTAAAALSLSRLFADRYARQGVLVNALFPAATADPEAIAREVAFLCSERASHVAGTAGVID